MFAAPRPAKAFAFVASNPDLVAIEVQKKVKKTIGTQIVQTGTIALVNALNYFVQKLAFDTATWIASAGPGQKPLFDGRSFGQYVSDVGKASAMKFMTELNDASGLRKWGLDVCAPNFHLIAKIQVGFFQLHGFQQPEEPRCDWKTMIDKWDEFGTSFKTGEVLKNFSIAFEPGRSDLGMALEINGRIFEKVATEQNISAMERQTSGGWKPVKDFISGKVTTPEDVVREQFGKALINTPADQELSAWSGFGTALGQGAWQIIPAALSNFTNTLLSKSMSRLMSGIFSPYDLLGDDQNISIGLGTAGAVSPTVGRRTAETIYSDFIKPRIISGNNYDPLVEFTACPERDDEKQINNCVLDDNFAAAIRMADQGKPLTVAQAIERGYLDGGKPLVSSKDATNERSDCYQSGYCYSNLVKLRKARILPVGFELAAELTTGNVVVMKGSGGITNTLRAFVDNFNQCNDKGERDDAHPYCHMIDPNWVLRLPKTQCMAKVYGPTLASSAGNLRAETCADPIACIAQDENGNCTGGYGYCTKEKNIWRIPADKCSEQFNTCLTYKTRDNKSQNYLKNTIEFGACDATNVGCRPYSNNQKFGVWSIGIGDAVYFNKDAEKCEAQNAGCMEFYSKEGGLAYNLLPNSSFENFSGFSVSGWTNEHDIISDGSNSFDGNVSAKVFLGAADELATVAPIKLELNTPYTVSAYAKGGVGGPATAVVGARLFTDAAATKGFDTANLISTCNLIESNSLSKSASAPTDIFNRFSCSFLTPNQTLYAKVFLSNVGNGAVWYDAVQLEEGSPPAAPTTYLSKGYGAADSVFIKAAPKYLDCQAGTTDPQCANYAPTCRADEVGCERYTPVGGGPSIAGVANINDVCPAVCAGYETFRQEATIYETEKFPNYFIPATAKACAAPDVGCDEFTNMATEAKEYFGFVRQCIKLDPKDQWDAFYTWEGNDTTGYQLRAHKLKVGEVQAGETGPVPAIADKNYAACTHDIFIAKIGNPNYNPDCREFYNTAGKVSYRLLSRTIIATDECAEYRKTESTEPDCNASGGIWNPGAQYCIYKGYKAESRTCGVAANKCRAYSGAAASNLRIVSQEDFESGDGLWKGGTVSSEALSAGGHSFKLAPSVLKAEFITKDITDLVSANSTYMLTFWAKGAGNEKLTVKMSDAFHGAAKSDFFAITLKGDWQYFELGPIQTKLVLSANPTLQIKLELGKGFYVDNIILNEVSQKLYLIKDSWKTPAECDQTINGLVLPQAMLGCKAYNNRSNETVYLKSFGSLCRDEAVGCGAFQDTKNSASDKNEIWNAICSRADTLGGDCKYNNATVCSVGKNNSICRFTIADGVMPVKSYRQSDYKDFNSFQAKVAADAAATPDKILIARDESTVEIAADETVYLVNDKKYQCKDMDLGCSVLGQPELYTGGNITQAYYKNKPGDYSKILCTAEAEGCESWTSDKGLDYFKVPKSICEYKDASGGYMGGWYKKDKTDEACYTTTKDILTGKGTGVFIKDGGYGIWRNADQNYDGSVGTCPQAQNACTEFKDPLDTSGANKTGKPYYLIDNDKLKGLENDPACSGRVSLTDGCVLFNKTSDINLKWNTLVSYFKADQDKKLATPISMACGVTPAFLGWDVDPLKSCKVDSDCPGANTPVFSSTYTGKCVQVPPDSNTILKVTRDRECGEWLTCKTSYSATDPLTSKTKPVCAELGLCDKVQAGAGGSAVCTNFIVNNPDKGKVLTADYYSKRDTGWAGKDYSGYSLGGKVPVTDITFLNINWANPAKPAEVRMFGRYGQGSTSYDLDLREIPAEAAEKSICRGYPEQESPFPSTVAEYDMQGFKNASVCSGTNCECDYTKLTYGSAAAKKYVNYRNRSVATGICQGGSRDGLSCKPGVTYDEDQKNSCGKPEEGGTCLKLQRQDDVIGWSGYCLERDLSTPINGDKNQKACLTWLPQDVVPGARDIYNQFRTAGYVPPIGGGKYYCLQAKGEYVTDEVAVNQKNHYIGFLSTSSKHEKITDPNIIKSSDCFKTGICGTGESVCGTKDGKYYCSDGVYSEDAPYAMPSAGVVSKLERDPFYAVVWGIKDVASFFKVYTGKSLERRRFEDGKDGVDLVKLNDHDIYGNREDKYTKVSKQNIDAIEIKFLDSNYNESFQKGVSFFIENGRKVKNYMAGGQYCDGVKVTDNCSGENVGNQLVKTARARSTIEPVSDGEYWYWRYDDGEAPGRDFRDIDFFQGDDTVFANNCKGELTDIQSAVQIRFHFKKNGQLDEVAVAHCEVQGVPKVWFKMQLLVHSREVCTAIVDVAASKNAALTDNLWKDNLRNLSKEENITGLYHYDYEVQPFGSAAEDVAPNQTAWYSYYSKGRHSFAGVPWSCQGNCGTPGVIDPATNKYSSDGDPTTVDFDVSKSKTEISNQIFILDTIKKFLRNLFAKAFYVYYFNQTTGQYSSTVCPSDTSGEGGCFDYRKDKDFYPPFLFKPPQIYSYNPSRKLDNGQFALGEPWTFIVNGAPPQDLKIFGNQYLAVVRFYAWADRNKMPLKSIKVDWGDGGLPLETVDGLYKNHKPLCAKSNTEGAYVCSNDWGIVCIDDSDCSGGNCVTEKKQIFFGNSPDACEEGYFEFQHTYTCDKPSGQSCDSYTPKVTVVDNWGASSAVATGGKITLTP